MPRRSSKTSVELENDEARMPNDKGPGNKLQNSKHQAPKKQQAPSSKTDPRGVCPCIRFWALVFEFWNFSGAWGLGVGAWGFAQPRSTTQLRCEPRENSLSNRLGGRAASDRIFS